MEVVAGAPSLRAMNTTRFVIPLAAVAAALGLAACGSSDTKSTTSTAASTASTTAAAPGTVPVVLKEFKILPASPTAKAGKVTFALSNAGAVKHEFIVIKTNKQAGDLGTKSGEASEAGSVGEEGNLPPGSRKTLVLNLKAGHYALICNLPGHYKAGQYANFSVTS